MTSENIRYTLYNITIRTMSTAKFPFDTRIDFRDKGNMKIKKGTEAWNLVDGLSEKDMEKFQQIMLESSVTISFNGNDDLVVKNLITM